MADQSAITTSLYPPELDAPSGYTDGATESLTPADIRDFQQLLKDSCGESLNDGEAWTRATQLIGLLRMFMRPLQEDPETTPVQEVRASSHLPNFAKSR